MHGISLDTVNVIKQSRNPVLPHAHLEKYQHTRPNLSQGNDSGVTNFPKITPRKLQQQFIMRQKYVSRGKLQHIYMVEHYHVSKTQQWRYHCIIASLKLNESNDITRLCTNPEAASVNTLRPWQNGRPFADDVLKCSFLKEYFWISNDISLNLFSQIVIIYHHRFR